MDKIAKVTLGVIYPGICLALGLGMIVGAYSDLPNRITVHFDITRVPTTSLPISTFVTLMSTILILSTLACSYIAIQKGPFDLQKYQTVASYGGFFSAISASLMVGAVVIHKGLTNWHHATGPGWWILLVVIAGFAGGGGARYLIKIIHEQGTKDSKAGESEIL